MLGFQLLFADAHMHTTPKGLGARRVGEKFRSSGGWFVALVSLPPWHLVDEFSPSIDYYKRALDVFFKQCREMRETGLVTVCLAGFHPAEVDKLIGMGLKAEDVLLLGENVLKILESACKRGLIDGIGEVGRQHYKTMPERVAIAEILMLKAAQIARDNNCIIHLHLENAGPATVETTAYLLSLVNANPQKIFFHHASIRVALSALGKGFAATIPGKYAILEQAFKILPPEFLVESDYIDDPRRPCVSSCPWEIIESQKELLRKGVVDEDRLARINIDNVVKYYGVKPP